MCSSDLVDAEIAHSILNLGMTEKDLDVRTVPVAPYMIDAFVRRNEWAPYSLRVRQTRHPFVDKPSILMRAEMPAMIDPAREEISFGVPPRRSVLPAFQTRRWSQQARLQTSP